VLGTVAGALLVGVLDNILQLNDVDSNVQLIVVGVVIVFAAGLQRLRPASLGAAGARAPAELPPADPQADSQAGKGS
jgi:ribose transport system permease protein